MANLLIDQFFNPDFCSLKICGVTRRDDAEELAAMGVDALGVNFWPQSKRYLAPEKAGFLSSLAGEILRVGVFVNAANELPIRLFRKGLIDVAQLHGDESETDLAALAETGIPLIRALSLESLSPELFVALKKYEAALLLDAHAPGVYGGTGRSIDWKAAADVARAHPDIPLILAGGITMDNAAEVVAGVHPCALDTASGSESAPGIKDFTKVRGLLAATQKEQ